METEFAGLTLEEEEDKNFQIQSEEETNGVTEVLQLVGCFLTACIVYFPAIRSTMANLWHPVRGVQIRDLGEKSDSFCEAKMALGAETKEMGWDLLIRAQSRRAQMMTSVWLREECEGQGRGNNKEWQTKEVNVRDPMDNMGNCEFLDPILGINLVGREYHTGSKYKNESGNLENSSMEHDLEDDVIVGE
ncbi:hypothetical protein Gotri_001119 [Gossypium trilobum]|uniref:Uncharacterized protein n=1 Tax=Gossypium trilobum TaxID=34281 RepID=A0A7J9FDZ3_9ROSI|nr:hypothetical protein [Gossypium trilobum]